MDKISKKRRSKNMAAIKSKDTSPELQVRRILYKMGIRYRIHKKDLPGKPDIYISKYKIAIFVHGCFWHMHENCIDGHVPKTNSIYWQNKLEKNVQRDKVHLSKLVEMGIKPVVIWACEVSTFDQKKSQHNLLKKLNLNYESQ